MVGALAIRRVSVGAALLLSLSAAAWAGPAGAGAAEGQAYCCFEFSLVALTSYTTDYGEPGMPPTWVGRTHPGNIRFGTYTQKRDWSAIAILRFRPHGDRLFLDDVGTRIRGSISETSLLEKTNSDDTELEKVPCDEDNQKEFHTAHVTPLRRAGAALTIVNGKVDLTLGNASAPLPACPNDEGHGLSDFEIAVKPPPKPFIRNADSGDSWRCAPAARESTLPAHTDGIEFLKHTWSGSERYVMTMKFFPPSRLKDEKRSLSQIQPGSRAEDGWASHAHPAEC